VGAGAVGATCANVMACREVASEVVLIDIKEGLSEGKMLDMYQCSTLMDFDTKLVGVTNDYKQTANSDVVVITSGIPRKPGMTREELQAMLDGQQTVDEMLDKAQKAWEAEF
jgi:malate dehydrogenase